MGITLLVENDDDQTKGVARLMGHFLEPKRHIPPMNLLELKFGGCVVCYLACFTMAMQNEDSSFSIFFKFNFLACVMLLFVTKQDCKLYILTDALQFWVIPTKGTTYDKYKEKFVALLQ